MHRLTSLCARHPWLTLGLVLLLVAFAVPPIFRTELAVGMDATLGPEHPVARRFDEFLERFGGGYPVLIAYECGTAKNCQGALDPGALAMAYAVSRQLEQSPFVARVSSPATAALLVASADLGIEARRLVTDGEPSSDPELRAIALADSLWSRTLLSADGRVGAIAVELASTESAALFGVVEEIDRALEPHTRAGFRFHQVGEPTMWVAAHDDSVASMVRVGIGTGGMLFATLLLMLRSLPAVLACLVTIGVNAALTLASLPLLGWQRSQLTEGAATVILVIGCAGCVHFVAHYLEERVHFQDEVATLVATTRSILAPCLLTSATTVASFVALASGGLFSLTRFGVVAVIGVSLAFVLTFSLLPALLVLLPVRPRSPRHSAAWHTALSRLADFGVRRGPAVLIVALGLACLGLVGITKLRVELSLAALWNSEHPLRRAFEFVAEHLQRPSRLEIEVTLPKRENVLDPDVLRRLIGAQTALTRIEGIEGARSVATLLLHANSVLRAGSATSPALDSEQAVGELVTLISGGDSGVLDPWLTLDQRHLRISAEIRRLSSGEQERLVSVAEETLRRGLPSDWTFAITGPAALQAVLSGDFARSQTAIVSASCVAVVALIGLYLRSLPWALLAMAPNAVALLLLFGAMGHLGVAMDFGAAIVGPVAIGIAADDTIHFLTAYGRGRRSGLEPLLAVRAAISRVGEAVIATAVALALGFLSMLTSPFPTISNLGLLCALAIVGATLADLVLLPALIAAAATARERLLIAPKRLARSDRLPPA
jgi:predicted RND superfamily exporter protein